MSKESFNVKAYLEDKHIPYYTEGKNVTRGWIEINCPFCSDPSQHCGVNLSSKMFHCWICGAKGVITKLIQELEDCSYQKAEKIISQYQDLSLLELKQDILKRYEGDGQILPKESTVELPGIHRQYLVNRGFDPEEICKRYHIKACYNTGKFKFRLIIPIIMDDKVVNFTARSVADVSPKYKHCPNEKAITPMRSCIYNIDSVLDTVLIVEGPLDVWRIGKGSVALMGIEFTEEQIELLQQKELKKAVVMFDGEPQAIRQATKLAAKLSAFVPIVYVIELPIGKDPDTLDPKTILEIQENVFKL